MTNVAENEDNDCTCNEFRMNQTSILLTALGIVVCFFLLSLLKHPTTPTRVRTYTERKKFGVSFVPLTQLNQCP